MKKHGKLFVVSAPSGAGKSTLVKMVCDSMGKKCHLERVITYTSKHPRQGEKDGLDYHFCSKEAFEQKIQEGFFIEWSSSYGHYYGSPIHIMEELSKGKYFILVIDRAGAHAIANHYKEVVLIWIFTQNMSVLEDRLRLRNTENNVEILKRIALAKQEIEDERVSSFYHYHVLNDKLEIAVQQIEMIVSKELGKCK